MAQGSRLVWSGPVLFALALLVRLPGIGRPEIGDESAAVVAAGQTLTGIVELLVTRDAHPPLYFFLIYLWGMLSRELWWLRLLSVAFGAAACVLIYKIGAETFSPWIGRVTFFVVTLSPLLVFISQYLRPYSLALLLSVASVFLVTRLLRASDSRSFARFLAGYTACAVLVLYTFYFSLFVVLAVNLFLFVHFMRWAPKRLAAWGVSAVIVGLAYLPWLPYYAAQMERVYSGISSSTPMLKEAKMGFYVGTVQVGAIARAFLALLQVDESRASAVRVSVHYSEPVLLLIVLAGGLTVLCLAVTGYWRLRRSGQLPALASLVLLVAGVPIGCAVILSVAGDLGLFRPIAINLRYFGESAAFFAFVLSAWLLSVKPRFLATGAIVALCLLFAVQLRFIYDYPFNDQSRLLEILNRNQDIELVVSFTSSVEPLFDKTNRQRFRDRYRTLILSPDGVESGMSAIARHDRFYLFQITTAERMVQFPTFARQFELALKRHDFVKAEEERVSDVLTVAVFERRGLP